MERVNFQSIEKKWQSRWENKKLYRDKKSKNFTAWKCSLILLERYIWGTSEITL